MLPLTLTLGRLAAPLLICPLIFIEGTWPTWLAAALFTLAAISDSLDGWVARRFGVESQWGRILDPIADKVLVLLTLLALAAADRLGTFALILVFGIFARELIMSALREGDTARADLAVSTLSKAKTFLTYVALGFLILGGAVQGLGTLLLAIALILGLVTLTQAARKVFDL